MKKIAIIAAGGAGVRMGAAIPKQFLVLRNKPVIWHSLQAFRSAFNDIMIVIVAPADHLDTARHICKNIPDVVFVAGGDSRFQSVKNGLNEVKEEAIVFVHDAVRCLVTPALIRRCYEQALEKGSAIPAVAIADSVRIVEGEKSKVLNREQLRVIQTPQTFHSNMLSAAFNTEFHPSFTDEATVVEYSGNEIHLIEGEHTNIKITRPADLVIAETILAERSSL